MRWLSAIAAVLLLASAPALSANDDGSAPALERPSHDHTIFILSGDPKSVADFHSEVGANWDGGALVEADEENGVYRYWAFAWRTARQSRAFLMPAIFGGLELEFEPYDDAVAFPDLRLKLDQVALSCGMRTDPFLIHPFGDVTIEQVPDDQHEAMSCALLEFRDGGALEGIKLGFIGNEKLAEEEGE